MPGLSFLSKKSWHTSNISNQEKVWIAEQKAAAEEAKLKELTLQIKLEREQEELQRITGKKSSGDRGVDWMYEGHNKRGEENGDDEERRKLEEEAANEAYLLGKEFAPKGQTKLSGDFAVAASMTGALEKASTIGASIGVAAAAEGGWMGDKERGAGLRIRDDTAQTAAAATTMNEWNHNFHLRQEDPMFSVMQRKQAKDKEVEKKKRLMAKAGLVMKEPIRPTTEEKMQHDKLEDKRRDKERRRRHDKDSKKSKKKRKHKHHRRSLHHHKRSRRERSPSPSDNDYSSTVSYSSSSDSSSVSSRRGDQHYIRKEDDKKSSSHRHRDNYDRHHSSGKRSGSRERRRRRSRSPGRNHDGHERLHKHELGGGERRMERSRSYSVDREEAQGDRRSSRGDNYRKNNSHPRKEGFGLIGTSLSNRDNSNTSLLKPSIGKSDYLGPDQKLLAVKREEVERQRQSRFEQGRKRRYGDADEKRGHSYQDRQRAVEEMERNARDREQRQSK